MNRTLAVPSAPALVIMAAGLGSRYGGLKQVEPVGPTGCILLEYAIFDALREGFGKVVFIVRKENEGTFRDLVGRTVESRVDVAYVHQGMELPAYAGGAAPESRTKPWGTGHAVLACRDAVRTPFAVINADDFYGRSSYRLIGEELAPGRGDGFCMVGFPVANTLTENGTVARGVCTVGPDGYLEGVVERTRIRALPGGGAAYAEDGDRWVPIPADAVVSLNTWGFTPAIFPALEEGFAAFLRDPRTDLAKSEFYLPSVVDTMVASGLTRVKVLPTRERWYGMTYKEDLPVVRAAVQAMVEAGEYPARLWDGADGAVTPPR